MDDLELLWNRSPNKEYAVAAFYGRDINAAADSWMNERAHEGFVRVKTEVCAVSSIQAPYTNVVPCLVIEMERDIELKPDAIASVEEALSEYNGEGSL